MTEVKKSEFEGGKEVESSWMKFLKVGDGIKGTLLSKHIQKASQPNFQDQLICEIRKANGEVWNVGISVKKVGTVSRIQKCQIGEIIGIVFDSEGESAIKGGQKAKNLKVYSFGMDPEYKDGNEVDVDEIPM